LADERKYSKNANVAYLHLDLDEIDGDHIEIIPVGDIHYGVPKMMMTDLWEGTLEYIKETDNAYVILMGDILEMASRKNASDVWSQKIPPSDQIDWFVETFKPISDKIICMIEGEGTHEYRPYKDYGISAGKVCGKLCNIKYCYPGVTVGVSLGDYSTTKNYTLYAIHGSTSATTPEGKMRACRRLGNFRDVDIFLHAHVHDLQLQMRLHKEFEWKRRRVFNKKRAFVLTGHFTEYDGNYAEGKTYEPGKPGVAKIKLYKDRWDFHITI